MEEKFVDRSTTKRERQGGLNVAGVYLIVLYPSMLHHARGCSQNQAHPIPWISTNIHKNIKFRIKECRDSSLLQSRIHWNQDGASQKSHAFFTCCREAKLVKREAAFIPSSFFAFYDVKNEATFVKKKKKYSVHSVTAECFE